MEFRIWKGKQFYSIGPEIGMKRVNDFCAKYDLWLPSCYKDFLVKVNGGKPVDDVFVIPGMDSTIVGDLAGIDEKCDSCNLEMLLRDYPIPRSRGFIQIGYDAGASGIYIRIHGSTRGSLWFADRFGDEELGNLWFVARSFSEFVLSLRKD